MTKVNKIFDKNIDGGINIDNVKSLSIRSIEGDYPLHKMKVRYIFDEYMPQEKHIDLNLCSVTEEYDGYKEKSIHVIDDTNDFVNGYKVVELSNHKFGYIKEETNKLIPLYFEVALNFNDYGLAMVGKRNSVAWIDKNFGYIEVIGGFCKPPAILTIENVCEYLNHEMAFKSFSRVCEFSNNQVPLSMVSISHVCDSDFPPIKNQPFYNAAYVDINGMVKQFTYYDGNFSNYPDTAFITGISFNELGYALASNMDIIGERGNKEMVDNIKEQYILFDNGIYCNMETYRKLCIQNGGVIPSIKEDLEKKKILTLK